MDVTKEGGMTRKRRYKNLRLVATRRPTAKKTDSAAHTGETNENPDAAGRVIEFPKPRTADDEIKNRTIIKVGNCRFAIRWTAEIEQLPPAGPVAGERKQGLK